MNPVPARPLRIGILGGAFDPPHRVHRALAVAAIEQLSLDTLHVLPTGQAWHKSRDLTPAQHRLAMCRLAFAGLPQVLFDERELRRSGPTYTIHTLRELQVDYPGSERFLLIGTDQLLAFKTWYCWQEVLQCATLVVAGRGSENPTSITMPSVEQDGHGVDIPCLRLQMPVVALSSTAVRARLQEPGTSASDLGNDLGQGVADYIFEHCLYR